MWVSLPALSAQLSPIRLGMLALVAGCSVWSSASLAIGEKLMDQLISSDFVYDRNISNAPPLMIGYLDTNAQNGLTFDGECPPALADDCRLSYRSLSQGFGTPVWVGQKNMLVLGETLDVDYFSNRTESFSIYTGGVLAAWINQPSEQWQQGAFVYNYWNLGDDQERADTSTTYAGYVARYRHSARFHSYLGLIYTDALERALVFPYAAFDWFVDDRWTISAILPWPLLTYSPNPDQAFKVGAVVTGSSWASASDGDVYSRDFTQLNLGFVFEQRLSELFWGEFSLGYAGLGRLSVDSDQDSELETNLESSPYFRIGITVRPF
ncbi:hypothetical protein [Cellvibrio sp. NN19]|uniref:hypothetical protein n=1 Tax=Cellvibrio chitinivorans TaxID=3102792 RepID=UPI002B413DFB|nr:hypothetical protein [Cellvibrio sp. NN19]